MASNMTKQPDIPKRLAARIRGAQERVQQQRVAIVAGERNYAQSSKRLAEFNASPEDFASRHYGRNAADSYPVQTTIARERERVAHHEKRRPERIRALAMLESELMRIEQEVLVEVTGLRPSSGRVPWPGRLPAFKEFRAAFQEEMRQADERWRIERAEDDAEFERLIAAEEAANEERHRLEEAQLRREIAAMSSVEYANYRAWADFLINGLRSGQFTMENVLESLRSRARL
ncbi:hypothetical protein FXN63_18235 [Pigmentiphaga aceris]|uniref:Uncharacterized protein n=1 Tax=Pigmentiphaga aceris TaxID=1940612 RepID=A0A5C0AYR2_9BURK|nr:hypothetical protein [Pigmentiphaga aceris]QEI07559.1 hypothetical protein FXN63_18235 [Pigmentiphaga aceris]